jgi:apolipoprotein N-acyltransferase
MERLRNLAGWRGHLLTFLLGCGAALSMPPLNFWPLLLIVYPAFLLRLRSATRINSAMAQGWLFGFGYFCVALHWIGFAFLIEAETFLWMMPFAVGGLAAVLSVYWGIASVLTVAFVKRGCSSAFVFPVCLAGLEYLRGQLFTGFPWAVPGLASIGMGGVVQAASVIGMMGLSLLVLTWASAPVLLLRANPVDRFAAVLILASLPAVWIWGEMRLATTPTYYEPAVSLRIVQPNVPQEEKWRFQNASQIFDHLIELTDRPPAGGAIPTHIIWPEAAVPFLIDESPEARARLADVLDDGQTLFTGTIRRQHPDPASDYFTSIISFDANGKMIGSYDKWRLVPGGEYLPFAWLLEPLGLRKLVVLPGSFTAGQGPGGLDFPGVGMAAPAICYEIIFPQGLVDQTTEPRLLLNVTNDGWFGRSSGPYQHFAQARMRAIEQGLPLVRAANTGLSGVVDPVGRIIVISSLTETKVLDAQLPKALSSTFYRRNGDFGVLAVILVWFALLVVFNYTSRSD